MALGQGVGSGGHHAGQSWGHFRTQRQLATTAIFEMEQLRDDPFTTLGGVQVEILERGAVIFSKAMQAGYVAPLRQEPVTKRCILGIEITSAFNILKLHRSLG